MGFWGEEVFEEAEKQSFDVLPEGEYTMLLVDAKVKETKAGTGNYVNAQFEITGPTCAGRKVFQSFNVQNPNSTAVSIGLGQLKEFLSAASKLEFYESLKTVNSWQEAEAKFNQLFDVAGNIPVVGKVVIKKSDKYGDDNEVKRFKAATSAGIPDAAKKPADKKKPF